MGSMSVIWTEAKWVDDMEVGKSYWWIRDNMKVEAEILSIQSDKGVCTVKYRRMEYLNKN